ncbi:MAG: type II toxin-antitoxin system Phd/YefM family antitoxin [Lachnospiraceae bacterium]|nr:type II toxin-antitoxin system Phd/YefM family antitoxin [Lachnospiraceae bacterium]
MPQIIPIRDLKNTAAISQMCQESTEPIYVTKNGYGDMVIMSMKIYQEKLFLHDIYDKLAQSEADVTAGRTKNAKDSLQRLKEKHNV